MSLLKQVLAFVALFFTVLLTTVQTGAAQNAYYPPAFQNIVNNLPTIKEQANSGIPQAQYTLAVCYSRGWGVPHDLVESVKWVRKSAEQGYPNAQHDLGIAYSNGVGGLQRDMAASVKWIRKAAEQGFPPAQFNLGQAYLIGIVVQQDVNIGMQWIRLAANQGFQPAIQVLNRFQPVIPQPAPFPGTVPMQGFSSGIPQGMSGLEILQDIYRERETGVSEIHKRFEESQERARFYQFLNELDKETEETYRRQMEMNKLYYNYRY